MAKHPPSEQRKRLLHLLAYSEICEAENCHAPALRPTSSARHLHLPESNSDLQELDAGVNK
jgi:hypothetical protein